MNFLSKSEQMEHKLIPIGVSKIESDRVLDLAVY